MIIRGRPNKSKVKRKKTARWEPGCGPRWRRKSNGLVHLIFAEQVVTEIDVAQVNEPAGLLHQNGGAADAAEKSDLNAEARFAPNAPDGTGVILVASHQDEGVVPACAGQNGHVVDDFAIQPLLHRHLYGRTVFVDGPLAQRQFYHVVAQV